MSWIITGTEKLPSDPDAAAYITAVEAADGQPLETEVRMAINTFVKGCKADGIWDAIKASCILAGARTLSGALVPLVGTAPTNFNFVAGDYDRKTGLVGDGTTKYLNINRNQNLQAQNNVHLSIFGSSILGHEVIGTTSGVSLAGNNSTRCQNTLSLATAFPSSANTMIGCSRSSSSFYVERSGSVSTIQSLSSQFPADTATLLFRNFETYFPGNACFYSIGEALDLALLDARVTTLIAQFAAAIP